MTDIIADLSWRGLVHQTTDESQLRSLLGSGVRTLYCGFDPTADSLHVGHLMGAMTLRRFQRAGHRPIALVGGATGMIGDPSGKSAERVLLSREDLQANVQGIDSQLHALLDFDAGEQSALLLNNYDWMDRYGYLEFLRDVGKNFPVGVMMAKDSVKTRLGRADSGMSYTEFSYMLLQAYDFVYLGREHGCELQIGGSDQWGNITAGIDLARRMDGRTAHGLTWPLLTKSDGAKMGKTESGAVWLAPERTSPYHFYQYWINVDDADAGKCLRYLTELAHDEIVALDAARDEKPHERESQRRLAEELTRMIHGEKGLAAAQRATAVFFGAEIQDLSDRQLAEIFADVPSSDLPRAQLDDEAFTVVDALVAAGLAASKGEARRAIKQGGAYLNNRRVSDADYHVTHADLASQTVLVLRTGKKRYGLLRFAR